VDLIVHFASSFCARVLTLIVSLEGAEASHPHRVKQGIATADEKEVCMEHTTQASGGRRMMFGEREAVAEGARHWWLFLVTGIGWLVFSLLVFQWDYTTIYAISYLFGFVALFAAVNEFMLIAMSSTGWKVAHGLLAVLFTIAGIWALAHPHMAFNTIAGLVGFFLLFKGIFDLFAAIMTRAVFEFWWVQLVLGIIEIVLAFWVAGHFQRQVTLLVAYVGIMALARGITELIFAFKLKGLRPAA
jgi:uncharacterized membrane protein HdeD (DUF308 family)